MGMQMHPPTQLASSRITTYIPHNTLINIRKPTKHGPLMLLAFLLLHTHVVAAAAAAAYASSSSADHSALQAFKTSAGAPPTLLTWHGMDHCSGLWYGVSCQHGRVTRLVLDNLLLHGSIHLLAQLDQLRVLSLTNNFLNDTLPNMSTWKYLRFLYLSQNNFSGFIPDSIAGASRLLRIDLSNNMLTGQIPASLNCLSDVLTLRLQINQLSGSLPDLNMTKLKDFNVSSNKLSGQIPRSLSAFPVSSFQGNRDLCGNPFSICQASSAPSISNISDGSPMVISSTPSSMASGPSRSSTSSPKSSPGEKKASPKISIGALIAIILGDIAAVILISCAFILYYRSRYPRTALHKHSNKNTRHLKKLENYPMPKPEVEKGKLVFMDSKNQFELEDLLRASAELLGKGSFGTAYKAALEDGSVVVVKRLKDVNGASRSEFEQHMDLIGRLRHPNLVCLRAYFYAREEKLVIYDFLPCGNLFSLLHGNRVPGRTPVDWTTRLKIALGAARGLAFIHHQCKAQKLPHGNIKSSNVLVDKNGNACISDFGLVLMASSSVLTSRLIGYRAPEHNETKKVSQRGDVYSFGVLLLEILTGKAPTLSYADKVIDLPKWVQSVVQEEWTAEVFDVELMRYKNIEEEMVTMLQIAMACVCKLPEQRPKMNQVVQMIESIVGGGDQQPPSRVDSFDSLSMSPGISEDSTGTSQ